MFGAAPPLNVLLHSLAPDKMIGLSFRFRPRASAIFRPPAGLPVVGGIFGMGQQMNPEAVLAMQPDIALAWKSPFIDQARIEGGVCQDWPARGVHPAGHAGRLAGGAALHRPVAGPAGARRNAGPSGMEAPLAKVAQVTARIPLGAAPRVYYAEGPDGLATDCHQSFHTEAIELAGGYNVFTAASPRTTGMEKVSLEQVLAFALTSSSPRTPSLPAWWRKTRAGGR